MADYQLTQTGNEVQALLNDVAGEEFVRTADMTDIPANSDLNNYKTAGTYHCTANADVATIANCPASVAFQLVVNYTVGSVSPTQEVTSYEGDKYIRTYRSWTSSWGAWTRVGKTFTTRVATVTVGKVFGSYVSLSAPSVSGYTFLCWVGSATTGWVGGTYIESMNSASTRIWVCASTESSGTGNVNAWALYVQN
ncbi:MAG: hypothetical protein IIY21_22915 [Clostridiales bacterium]|nr:hypothetical protein [Clostridiales bacterium]